MSEGEQKNSKPVNPPQKRKKLVSTARYMGLAFQLFATIAVAVLLGYGIDNLLNIEKPIFTVLLIPPFLFVFIYRLYLDINQSE